MAFWDADVEGRFFVERGFMLWELYFMAEFFAGYIFQYYGGSILMCDSLFFMVKSENSFIKRPDSLCFL